MKSKVRTSLGLVIATFVFGVVFATTAQAWHPVVTGSAKCESGKTVITWVISNGEASTMHTTSRLGNFDVAAHGSKTLSESVSGFPGSVKLEVSGSWTGHEQNVHGEATVNKLHCETPPPPPPHCDDEHHNLCPPPPPVCGEAHPELCTPTTPVPPTIPPTPPVPPVEPPVVTPPVEEALPATAVAVEHVPFTG